MRLLTRDEAEQFIRDGQAKLDECRNTAIDKTLDWKNRLTALKMGDKHD
jgi:hypothetical protein